MSSIPVDHHFVPRFYLRRWSDAATGQLCEYSRPYRDVQARCRHPGATGKQRSLYSIEGEADPKRRERVELETMSPVDNDAAAALAHMERTHTQPESEALRDGWVRFVISLLHRSPHRLAYLERRIRNHEVSLSREVREQYERLRGPDDPPDPSSLLDFTDPERLSRFRASLLGRLIDSVPVGQVLVDMTWHIVESPAPHFGLLTGDDPLIVSDGLKNWDSYVALPLSPTRLFVASWDRRVPTAFAALPTKKLERAINHAICVQAQKFVFGADAGQKGFVERRLGKSTPPTTSGVSRHTWNAPF